MIRTFIAIELDEPARQKIAELISRLKTSQSDVKWITENQMHLTLKFLGNVDENKIPEISEALKSIADKFSSFDIHLSGIGVFPNLNRPRVIWLGIDKGADEVKKLNNLIETYLEKLEFAREKREFKPHLTLGRVRSFKNIYTLTKLMKEMNFDSGKDIEIKEVILFQSTLAPKGAIYNYLYKAQFISI